MAPTPAPLVGVRAPQTGERVAVERPGGGALPRLWWPCLSGSGAFFSRTGEAVLPAQRR